MDVTVEILLTIVFVATLPSQLLWLTTVHPAVMFLYACSLITFCLYVLRQGAIIYLQNKLKPTVKYYPNALEEYQEILKKQRS